MNILRYKQRAQNSMPQDSWGGDSSSNSDSSSDSDSSSGYGVGGWGPPTSAMSPLVNQPASNGGLSGLFAGSSSQKDADASPTAAQDSGAFAGTLTGDNLNSFGTATPSWFQRMGIIPGMSQPQFFSNQTQNQQDDRMGMIGAGMGAIGSAFTNMMMPAPMRMALGGLSAYNNYEKTGNVGQSIGMGLSSLPGYASAAGQALQGNYGSALSRIAGLNGVNGFNSSLAGMSLDAATGKDVTPKAYSLGGMYLGNKLGGPVGGVLGNQLGNQFARLQGYR